MKTDIVEGKYLIIVGGVMKKFNILIIVLGVLAAIAGVLWIAVTLYTTKPHSYTIIGGADGPTSIFIAGKYGACTIATAVLGGIILSVAGILLIVKKGIK